MMLRYSEIPHDFSAEDIKFVAFRDDYAYENFENDPRHESNLAQGTISSPYKLKLKASAVNDEHVIDNNSVDMNREDKRNTKVNKVRDAKGIRRKTSDEVSIANAMNTSSGYNGNGSLQAGKTQSLPPNTSMKDYDSVILNALRVPAEDLARQITLLDLPIFAAILPDELTSCGWTKKNKLETAPNIVAFTKRFNNTSFWTVQEILSGQSAKQRAETINHFIKVAKKLYDLNNLHSLFAIISALQSASVFRLKRTWSCLSKKDKQTFDRLADIFTDCNNWELLRKYLDSLRLPCIPYLGLFLTDLVYIDLAHPHSGGLESEQRKNKMNNILRIISNYQQSDYSHIQANEGIQSYLKSIRYIEELQNIFEEEQYKKSLMLEPLSSVPSSSSCSSKESFSVDISGIACLNLSPAKTLGSLRIPSTSGSKFIPTHRKCRSLGSNIFGKGNVHQVNSQTMLYGSDTVQPRHLLDDSVIENNANAVHSCDTISIESSDGGTSPVEGDRDVLLNDNQHSFQGCVRRKTVLKDGRKPAVASWQRYWLQIWANSLVYFAPKSFKGSERSDFKHEPCKVCPLDGWATRRVDNPKHKNTFELVNSQIGTIYRFRTDCPQMIFSWMEKIRLASQKNTTKCTSINLMSFE
ncbi:ras-specific guanine nucleotide-releasing factor RalGPS2 isoform X2 [Hermetia illucens]|uniref:ras-specific guanine nucleotide-releasing factor RalGPS2 isoform X2 n=1 Tax=Hermetia illucens TaxID=343691 RepID=UPI0018CC65EA|nr:ras-specific guanine nucleotide-releasing factor RalGPS2 isoform X2 [Hermetia illucens]